MNTLDAITESVFKKRKAQINTHILRNFSKMTRQNMSDNLDKLDNNCLN